MKNNENSKVGPGIMTVSILTLIANGFSFLGLVLALVFKDSLSSIPGAEAIKEISINEIIISIIIILLVIVSVILILYKKSLGIYGYFVGIIANFIYSVITTGFNPSSLISLILPILMAVFILKKKELYGFGNKTENLYS